MSSIAAAPARETGAPESEKLMHGKILDEISHISRLSSTRGGLRENGPIAQAEVKLSAAHTDRFNNFTPGSVRVFGQCNFSYQPKRALIEHYEDSDATTHHARFKAVVEILDGNSGARVEKFEQRAQFIPGVFTVRYFGIESDGSAYELKRTLVPLDPNRGEVAALHDVLVQVRKSLEGAQVGGVPSVLAGSLFETPGRNGKS